MAIEPQTVSAPRAGLYRLGHRSQGSFEPPDWRYADPEDGTFGNRFDDPAVLRLPEKERFRVIYCATERIGAFGETLARFRAPISLLASLAEIDDDEPLLESLAGAIDPGQSERLIIGADWRTQRMVSHTILDPDLRIVDLNSAQTIEHLRASLAGTAHRLQIPDIDESAIIGPKREFTQQVSRYFYEQVDDSGLPKYAGLRYSSRLDLTWECWALYADRIRHVGSMPGMPESIFPDDPDLIRIAQLWSLTIEVLDGSKQFYRP